MLQDVILTKAAWTPHWPMRVADVVLLIGVADGVDLDQANGPSNRSPTAWCLRADGSRASRRLAAAQIDQVLVVIYAC